ncbi:hypothetical protein A1355_19865 [Methylomonas koyamae]|uniref:Uncharacterized protein n=1 Tax=Methylomonas koyamae TaxID=702114 RepID=A0A177P4G4_9GAMM|nr:hypothetical protein A1355_19865 [Methylomonas koyamae]
MVQRKHYLSRFRPALIQETEFAWLVRVSPILLAVRRLIFMYKFILNRIIYLLEMESIYIAKLKYQKISQEMVEKLSSKPFKVEN